MLLSRDNSRAGRKLTQGLKEVKEAKPANIEIKHEKDKIKYALDNWTKRFADASAAVRRTPKR